MDTDEHCCVSKAFKARKAQRCSLSENRTREYIPAVHYDAAFNAFHHQAVDYLLPYPTKFDNISWWFSQWYVVIKSKVIFPRQVLIHTTLIFDNGKHRAYPQKWTNASQLQDIIKLVQDDLPREYQNSTLLLDWKKYGDKHWLKSRVTCLPPPPPKMPMRPFAYT